MVKAPQNSPPTRGARMLKAWLVLMCIAAAIFVSMHLLGVTDLMQTNVLLKIGYAIAMSVMIAQLIAGIVFFGRPSR